MIYTDVKICGGGYEAYFRSDLGGNCYRLFHAPSGAELLRTPSDDEELFSEIFLFGNAILFPPNRIRGGEFTFEGREYKFPVNEKSTGSHLHGVLYKTPFKVEKLSDSSVVFSYSAQTGEYLDFPHAFTLKRSYSLGDAGLSECVEMINRSAENMPFMLAFHTTFNVPFLKDSDADAHFLKLPVGREHIRDSKYLPTLEYVGGRERELNLCEGKWKINHGAVSAFYESIERAAQIIDESSGMRIVYEASDEYAYRLLWRREGARFVVVEPQTAAIDCFHLEESAEKKGLIVIPPEKSVKLYTKFSVK
jgi:aldose 1-epimerase